MKSRMLYLMLLLVLVAAGPVFGARDLKEDTAVTKIVGPFIDSAGVLAETALDVTTIDCNLYKNDATKVDLDPGLTAADGINDCVHVEDGYYSLELTETDTSTAGYLRITFSVANVLIFHEDFNVLPANIYDSKYSTDKLQVDVVQVEGADATDTIGDLANAACDTAIETYNLDLLLNDMGTELDNIVHDTSVMGILLAISDVSAFDRTTDSLQAVRDQGDSAWITATATTCSDKTGFSLVSTGLDAVTAWTVNITGDITGNLSGSVGTLSGLAAASAAKLDDILDGTGGTGLKLSTLEVTGGTTLGNTGGVGLTIVSTNATSAGMTVTGNTTGAGLLITGGATGHGLYLRGGVTSGNGLHAVAQTEGDGIYAQGMGTTQHGIYAIGGDTTSAGIYALGGNTSGDGIVSEAPTEGHGIQSVAAGTTKHGIYATGGDTSGDGIRAEGITLGDGMTLIGVGASQYDLNADIHGTLDTVTTATTATNVTTVNGLAANVITAASINDAALDKATFAADYWTAHTLLVHPGETVWYVSKDGNDGTGDGTAAKPELTIAAAVAEAASGDTIFIGPGTYSEQVDLDTANKSLTLQGAGLGKTVITTASDNTIILEDDCILRDLSAVNTHASGAGIYAAGKSRLLIERCYGEGEFDGIAATAPGKHVIIRDSHFFSPYDGMNIGVSGFLVENCTFTTDASKTTEARAVLAQDGYGTLRNCILYAGRTDTNANDTYGLLVRNQLVVEGCLIMASSSHADCPNDVIGIATDDTDASVLLKGCNVITSVVGAGDVFDLKRATGTLHVTSTTYDITKTSGAITHVPPGAEILADTGTDGVVVAAASKTGYALASNGLASVTAWTVNLTGNITGNLIGTVSTLTTYTGNTLQTGDSFARLGAPVGASLSVDIAAIKAETVLIVADTNELQTDWHNGGRLDLILDASSLGGGSTTYIYTVTSSVDASAIPNVLVWVTTDVGGDTVVASGYTSTLGKVTFYLDPGTYYFWRSKAGYSFTNPDTEAVP